MSGGKEGVTLDRTSYSFLGSEGHKSPPGEKCNKGNYKMMGKGGIECAKFGVKR